MQDPEIVQSRNALEQLRKNKRLGTQAYVNSRNDHKKLIRKKKSNFVRKSLSSRDSKEVWKTIHRILKPPSSRIRFNPEILNNYYTTLASHLCGKDNTPIDTEHLINNLPMDTNQAFRLKPTTSDKVNKIILNLRNDCSSGYDSLPVKFLKPVYEYITSPLVHIINNCIKTGTFPNQWKIARVCPIPKVKNPSEPKDFRPISILPVLSKVL